MSTLVLGLDTETSGKLTEDHRIIEIYAGLWDLEAKTRLRDFYRRIDPQRSIAAEAIAVHHITNTDLVGCPTWSMIGGELSDFAKDATFVVAHNGAEFDLPFINQEQRRTGHSALLMPVVDTMKQARWATPNGKLPTLGELCFACDVAYDADLAHAAEFDVKVMMDCFFAGWSWNRFALLDEEIAA